MYVHKYYIGGWGNYSKREIGFVSLVGASGAACVVERRCCFRPWAAGTPDVLPLARPACPARARRRVLPIPCPNHCSSLLITANRFANDC